MSATTVFLGKDGHLDQEVGVMAGDGAMKIII